VFCFASHNSPFYSSRNHIGLVTAQTPEVFLGSIASIMVLLYKDMQISMLEDIQRLKVKDLREILRSNSEATGGIKADLLLKVYDILMRHVLRPGENQQQSSDKTAQDQ